ncbi:MAG TPA: hypothetical protein PK771_02910 [Spirochaetota bacterium]|nr:hypothetical protein [Spirochaetota bacterium]
MRNIKFYLSFFLTFLVLFFSGCAVSELVNILNKVNNGEKPKVPAWDFEFKAPLIDMNMTLGKLLNDTVKLKDLLKDISGDATLDDTNPDGIYRIKYKINFPKVEDLADSDLKTKIQNTFSNNPFKYTTPDFPLPGGLPNAIWPLPSGLPDEDNGYYNYNLGTQTAVKENLEVDMEDGSINKDLNNDNSNDLELRGISAPLGTIKFFITLLDGNTPVTALMANDVSLDKFTLENKNCSFTIDTAASNFTTVNGNQVTSRLVFVANIPNPIKFNGYINPKAPDRPYKYLDIVDFNMKIKSGVYSSYLPAITPTPRGQGSNLRIQLDSEIKLGNEIYILGPLFPTAFDMGLSEFSGIKSLTDFFNKPVSANQNAIDKLTNKLISSISLGNMSLTFDATNDLPFAIDLKKMFNNATNFVNLGGFYETADPLDQNGDPTSDNSIAKDKWDSGIFSFYDRSGNNVRDTYSILAPKKVNGIDVHADSFLLPAKTGSISLKMENIAGFFQINNSRTNPTKYIVPKSIYFGKNIDMRGTGRDETIDVSLFSNKDLIKLGASIEMPITLKLFDTTDDIDILKALLGNSDLGWTMKGVTGMLPIGNIQELGLEMAVENSFPFGFGFSFDMIFDQSDDAKKKTVSLLLGSNAVSIDSGSIGTNEQGLYIATANTNKTVKLGIKSNFTYLDSKGVQHTYDGDILKLLNECNSVSMSMKLNFLPTKYESNIVDVVLSSNNSIKVRLIANGKAKFSPGVLIK